jgi:DinB superfamily
MPDLETRLEANRAAVGALVDAGPAEGPAWTSSPAPGKWSPSQIVEHVARSLEESANEIAGTPSAFPTLPAFVRPLVRVVFFNRVLKTGAFPKAKTTKALDPQSGPASPADCRARLESALSRFDQECRSSARNGGTVMSTVFGKLRVEDYVRFTELHVLHHRRQMAGTS